MGNASQIKDFESLYRSTEKNNCNKYATERSKNLCNQEVPEKNSADQGREFAGDFAEFCNKNGI